MEIQRGETLLQCHDSVTAVLQKLTPFVRSHLEQLTDFHDILYEQCVIRSY